MNAGRLPGSRDIIEKSISSVKARRPKRHPYAGFSPAGASLGGGAAGSSMQSSRSAPLFRTLFTARLTAQSRTTPDCEATAHGARLIRCSGNATHKNKITAMLSGALHCVCRPKPSPSRPTRARQSEVRPYPALRTGGGSIVGRQRRVLNEHCVALPHGRPDAHGHSDHDHAQEVAGMRGQFRGRPRLPPSACGQTGALRARKGVHSALVALPGPYVAFCATGFK